MGKFLGMIGAIAGGWFGWWLGAHIGIMTAYLLSVVGMGTGLYLAKRFVLNLFE